MSATLSLVSVDVATQNLANADLESYDASVVLADDQMTPVAERITAVISCVLDKASWVELEAFLKQFANRMLSVVLYDNNNPSISLVNLLRTECSDGSPFVKVSAQEVMGSTLMLTRVEVTAERPVCSTRPILSHVWKQSMSVDEVGKLTRTIEGQIRAFRYAPGTNYAIAPNPLSFAAMTGYAGIADLFRAALLPGVPAKAWRRISQSFVYDPTNTALQYTVTDKQFMHDVPDFVRVGDMDFTYERSAETAGIANCYFTCDLEADQNAVRGGAWGTGNRTLVEAAVKLSKTRINAAYSNVIITRMRVTEKGLLSGQSIRFELDAQMFPSQTAAAAGTIAPLAYMIGQQFTVVRSSGDNTVYPYGQASRVTVSGSDVFAWHYMQPHWVSDMINGMENCGTTPSGNMPYALLYYEQGDISNTGTIQVVVGDTSFTNDMNEVFDGKYSADLYQPPADDEEYATIVAHNVSLTNAGYKSGMVRLSPMYTTGADLVFQTQKPTVMVKERIEVARANIAPNKVFRPLPVGAFVVDEDWNVSYGKFDAQGQRMFIGTYERTYGLYDNGTSGRGFVTQTTLLGNVRAWGAPHQTLLPTIAKVATSASQATTSSVFAPASISVDEKYNTGSTETFLT